MQTIHPQPAAPAISTPWGVAHDCAEIIPGVLEVTTASHGGALISAERFARMPAALRVHPYGGMSYQNGEDWHAFEEDIEALFPLAFYLDELPRRLRAPIHDSAQRVAHSSYGHAPGRYSAAFAWLRDRFPMDSSE